jgi:DNA-binding LacI/PurR family transcriptional regulator
MPIPETTVERIQQAARDLQYRLNSYLSYAGSKVLR